MDASWAVGVAVNTTRPHVDCFFFFFSNWVAEKEKQWLAKSERGNVWKSEYADKRQRSRQREGRGIRWGSGKPPLRPWQPVIQTIRELTVLPTTVLHRAKKMTKINTGCVCVGGISVEPYSLSWSAIFPFSPSLSFTYPLSFSSLPLTRPPVFIFLL